MECHGCHDDAIACDLESSQYSLDLDNDAMTLEKESPSCSLGVYVCVNTEEHAIHSKSALVVVVVVVVEDTYAQVSGVASSTSKQIQEPPTKLLLLLLSLHEVQVPCLAGGTRKTSY